MTYLISFVLVAKARVLKQFQDQVVSLMPRNFRYMRIMSHLIGIIEVAFYVHS